MMGPTSVVTHMSMGSTATYKPAPKLFVYISPLETSALLLHLQSIWSRSDTFQPYLFSTLFIKVYYFALQLFSKFINPNPTCHVHIPPPHPTSLFTRRRKRRRGQFNAALFICSCKILLTFIAWWKAERRRFKPFVAGFHTQKVQSNFPIHFNLLVLTIA